MTAAERLLEYVKISTDSAEGVAKSPTTERQWDLARRLQAEMEQLGLDRVRLGENCTVYGELPATPGYEEVQSVGFLAHMDTAPAFSGEGVRPQVIENYDGGTLALGTSGLALDPTRFPHLPQLRGKTLITTDGTTLLGADDKAGIAEILTMLERLIEQKLPHGRVAVAFTPDEEVGLGAHGVDLDWMKTPVAYTVDGGAVGELEYETFNAAAAEVTIEGVSVHPGSAKGIMRNALLVAMEFNALLPGEIPANTEGYEGFYHLDRMSGNVARATLGYILRDHDRAKFESRKQTVEQAVRAINEKYGEGTARAEISDTYYNMEEKIRPHFYLIERAKAAMEKLGVEPVVSPVRGGTDGSILSFRGMPCPNLCTGGYGFHGPWEHITAEDMETCVKILMGIVAEFAAAK